MRDRFRRSESIEKAAVSGVPRWGTAEGEARGSAAPQRPPVLQEAAVMVAQRAQNPREFFRQRERAGSTSGSTSGTAPPAGPLGARPGTWGGGWGAAGGPLVGVC